LKQPVQDLLSDYGVDLANGGIFKELEEIQNYLSVYKIIVYDGLSAVRVILSGNSHSNKKLYLLYDSEHFNFIMNIKAVMARQTYVTHVTHCMTIHTSATEFATHVQRHQLVAKIGQILVIHASLCS